MIDLPESARWLLGGVLGLYLVVLFTLSIYATKKVENEEDYLVAGRRLPLFLAWGTLIATWFGAAAMTGSAEAAREGGLLGVILDPFACSATLVLAGLFFAKPMWRLKLLTMGDFFRRVYGTKAEVLACCIQVPSYFGWIAAQYIALGAVQQAYFGVPLAWGIFISMAITLIYTMIGGMWSVTLTDTAQIVIALVGLVVLADSAFSRLGNGSMFAGIDAMLAQVNPDHLKFLPSAALAPVLAYVGTWATGLFGNIPGQDLQQRIFASKSEKTAMWACILGGISYFAFGMIPVGLGLLSNITDPGEYEGKILQLMAGKYLTPTMAVVFVVSFVSIVVSTATSAVLAPATILGHNLLGRFKVFHGHGLVLDRLCVLLISLGGLALAYSGESIMGLLDLSLSIAVSGLFVPLLMGLYGRPRGQISGLLSMLLGFTFFFSRQLLEIAFLPLSEAAGAAGMEYSDFIAQAFPSSVLLYVYTVIPADLWGLGASFAGYFIGQAFSVGRPVINEAVRAEARGELAVPSAV